MRFYWLLPSFLSVFLLALPAYAGRLVSSRFDPNQNRLVFTTDDGVQPKAMLLSNPTRVVIELPGIVLDRPTVRQQFRGVVREFRVGQKDDRTTSLVIELIPGYTLDPQQVLVRGANPVQWSVQLPRPQRVEQIPSNPGNLPPLNPLPPVAPPLGTPQGRSPAIFTTASIGTSILNFQVTRDGFFLRTSGSNPVMRVRRDGDRETITVDIEGASLASGLVGKEFLVNRFGVRNVQFTQVQSSTPLVRMTLNVTENSPNWRAFFSSLGGIVLLPQGVSAAQIDPRSSPPPTSSPVFDSQQAVIESVELGANGSFLLIRADRPIRPTATWERATGTYRISIPSAQLASRVRGPQLYSNSPISRVRLQQVGSRIVDILVQPAPGVRIGTLSRISDQLISLQLIRSGPLFGGSSNPDSQTTIPVPQPSNDNPPPASLPPVRNGRVIVLIDPGHGGQDSGAPGIGGVLEKNIVLSVSKKVEAILRQSGVQVVMTRDSDYFVTLPGRVAMVPRVGADVFVSIHANSISNRPDVNGLEVYYFGPGGERLARTIHRSIIQNVGINDRGVRKARFYVLRKNSVPATLVELGFVTSPSEIRRLTSPAYQDQMASAIARGVLQFIQQNY